MVTVSKQQGIIITAVLGALLGCGGVFVCGSSLTSITYFVQGLSGGEPLSTASWFFSIVGGLCTGAGFIALPIIFYFLLVHGRPDDAASAR